MGCRKKERLQKEKIFLCCCDNFSFILDLLKDDLAILLSLCVLKELRFFLQEGIMFCNQPFNRCHNQNWGLVFFLLDTKHKIQTGE